MGKFFYLNLIEQLSSGPLTYEGIVFTQLAGIQLNWDFVS